MTFTKQKSDHVPDQNNRYKTNSAPCQRGSLCSRSARPPNSASCSPLPTPPSCGVRLLLPQAPTPAVSSWSSFYPGYVDSTGIHIWAETSYPSPNWIPLPLPLHLTYDLPLSPLPLSFCTTLSAAPRLMLGTQQGLSEQLPDGGMNGFEDATQFLIHNPVNAGSPCSLPQDCILLGQLLSSASVEDNTFHQIRPTAPIPPPCDSDPKSIRTSYKIIWQPNTYQNGPKVLLGRCIYPNSEIRIIVLSNRQRLERTPGEVETISRAPFSCTDSVTTHCTPPKSGLWAQLWENNESRVSPWGRGLHGV